MKEGWEYSKIGKLCKTYSGGTPLKNVKEYYQDGNIPWLRSGEVCKKYITETEMFITQKGLENSSAKYFPIDTVVVAMYGATAAQVGILKIEATSNQAVCGIIPNSKFLPEFLYYFFCYRKDFLASQAQGGAQPNISQIKIKNLEVPTPQLSEQQSIVNYLDSAFAKIDAMKANAEKALNEAKALFQASLKEMLEPKEGWEEKTLKEIVHPDCTLSYGIVQPGEHVENGIPVVRPVNFNDKVIVRVEGLKRTKREISEAYKRTILKGGEILLCVRGTTGTMGLASDELLGCNVTRGIVPIFFDKNVDKMFVYYQLLSPKLQIEIQKKTTGAALKQINIKDLRILHLMFPSLSEQQSIVATLDSLKSKVDRLQENFKKISQECDALKQAILRQVFE
jgi:type I restriction enzyme S subunit